MLNEDDFVPPSSWRASSSTWPSGRPSTGRWPRASSASSATPTPSCSSAGSVRPRRPRRDPAHERHYSLEEASALLPRVAELLATMRRARDRLGDAEAREALDAAGQTNGGGEPGKLVSEGFLELRESMLELRERRSCCVTSIAGWSTSRRCATAARSTCAGRRGSPRSASARARRRLRRAPPARRWLSWCARSGCSGSSSAGGGRCGAAGDQHVRPVLVRRGGRDRRGAGGAGAAARPGARQAVPPAVRRRDRDRRGRHLGGAADRGEAVRPVARPEPAGARVRGDLGLRRRARARQAAGRRPAAGGYAPASPAAAPSAGPARARPPARPHPSRCPRPSSSPTSPEGEQLRLAREARSRSLGRPATPESSARPASASA